MLHPISTIGRESRIAIVLVGSLSHRVFKIPCDCVEPGSQQARHLHGRALTLVIGELDMSRVAHIFAPISAFTSSSEKSDSALDPIVLFCGICFLAFLIAILTGVQGVWY
jgi:hypothetical protein